MAIDIDTILTKPVRHLYFAALEIVEDFDIYGEVLQCDEKCEYGPDTAIGKLKQALKEMED